MHKVVLAITALVAAAAALSSCKDAVTDDTLKECIAAGNSKVGNDNRAEALYKCYKLELQLPPPPSTSTPSLFGKYGKKMIEIWNSDLENGRNPILQTWQYVPIINAVREKSTYDLCKDQKMLNKISTNLKTRMRYADESHYFKQILGFCP